MRHTTNPLNWSISPGGVPPKRANKEFKVFFQNISSKFRVLKLRFLAFPGGPGGFREVREAGRNHFHLSWYLSDAVVTLRVKLFFFGFTLNKSGSKTQV